MRDNALADVLTLRDDRLFFVALLVAALPLWLTPYLPLVDAPQHAAQVASLREILRGNPVFTADLKINWFTPYLGGYTPLFIASLALPIVAATKLIFSLAAIGLPWMTGVVLRKIGEDDTLKWLSIPAAFSVGFHWGFLTFVVAVPLALGLVVLTVRLDRKPSLGAGLLVAAFAALLFFAHVVALGFAALICLAYLAGRNWRNPRRLLALALPYTTPLPLIAIWMTRMLSTEVAVQEAPTVYGGFRAHLSVLFTQLSGLDQSRLALGLIIVAAVLLLPLLAGYRPSPKPERWLPLVVGLAVYFAFPSYWLGTAFLFERLAVFIVPVWLIAWERKTQPSSVFSLGVLAMLAVWCSVNFQRFTSFGRFIEGFDTVLTAAEPGRRLASLPVCNASPYFSNPVLLHFGAWYQAERAGIADMSFATTHPSLVRYRDMGAPRIGDHISWYPIEFDWTLDAGDTYDYYLVCAAGDLSEVIFKDYLASVSLVANEGFWWLYRNDERFPDNGRATALGPITQPSAAPTLRE